MIEILHRYTKTVLYRSEDAATLRAAVMAAASSRADLSGATLSGATLSGATLSGADLSGADLSGATLYGANLYGATLSGADLSGATLYDANLSRATLSGADLSGADLYGANLSRADLSGADLYGANLSRADLYGATLSGADLSGANLSRATLSGATLYGANLSRANLSGATLSGTGGVNPYVCTPLLLLKDQPGPIRLYKLVNEENEGPMNGGIIYEIGSSYEVKKAELDPSEQCGAGINVATLDWCIKEWQEGYKVLIVEFTAKDIACIPTATDGKVRLFRCSVIGYKDLGELGLKKVEEEGGAEQQGQQAPA